jgi:hypothetical protein
MVDHEVYTSPDHNKRSHGNLASLFFDVRRQEEAAGGVGVSGATLVAALTALMSIRADQPVTP